MINLYIAIRPLNVRILLTFDSNAVSNLLTVASIALTIWQIVMRW